MRLDDDASIEEPAPWVPRPVPGSLELLAHAGWRRLGLGAGILQALPGMATSTVASAAEALRDPATLRERLGAAVDMARLTVRGPAVTPFNEPIGAHRRYDWIDIGLDDVREVKRVAQATVNDVILTIVSGALGDYLRSRRVNTDILDFVGAIPVNTRQEGDRASGTQVGAWVTTLPIAVRDPMERLAAVRVATQALKRGGVDPTRALYGLAELGGGPVLEWVVRAMRRLSPANVIVTNVPGPPFPLFLLGARMTAACPMVTLLAGQGLGIAVFSYCGRLFFGVNADWDLVPDLPRLMEAIRHAFDELRDATVPVPPPAAASVRPADDVPMPEETHGN